MGSYNPATAEQRNCNRCDAHQCKAYGGLQYSVEPEMQGRMRQRGGTCERGKQPMTTHTPLPDRSCRALLLFRMAHLRHDFRAGTKLIFNMAATRWYAGACRCNHSHCVRARRALHKHSTRPQEQVLFDAKKYEAMLCLCFERIPTNCVGDVDSVA